MQFDLSYTTALEKAEHLIALGDTTIHLRDDSGFPFEKVTQVEAGNSWRLSGPSGCYLIFEEAGLTFKLSVDFENRDANGRSASDFDRARLRELMLKLSPAARLSFAEMLETQVLPPMAERTEEFRQVMLRQADSEDCVRGLIAFAQTEPATA